MEQQLPTQGGNKVVNYVKSSIEELKKVVWPTKRETFNYTMLVIGLSLLLAAFIGGIDFLLAGGLQILINR